MSARAKVRRPPVELIEEEPPRLPPGRPVARGAALPVPAAPARPAPLPKLVPEREGGGGERALELPIPAPPLPAPKLVPEREEGGGIPPEVLRRAAEIRRRIRELEEEERRLLAPYTGA